MPHIVAVLTASARTTEKRKVVVMRKQGISIFPGLFQKPHEFVIRYEPLANRFYDRKKAKTNRIIGLRAVARKKVWRTHYSNWTSQSIIVELRFAQAVSYNGFGKRALNHRSCEKYFGRGLIPKIVWGIKDTKGQSKQYNSYLNLDG